MDRNVEATSTTESVSELAKKKAGKATLRGKKKILKSRKVKDRKKRVSRNFPAASFEEAVEFAKAIFRIGSGSPVRRLTLFNELGKSPESSASRMMITHAGKYGLITGGYQAEQLGLTPDGLRAIDEEAPSRERAKARIKLAIEDIEIFKGLYDRFVGTKLPARAVLADAAKELGGNLTQLRRRWIRLSSI